PAVFGVNKTFKGGSDVFVAAFNRNTNVVRWVTTSGFDDGDNKKNREVLVGMSTVNGKMVVAAYAEETTEHKPQTALVYTLSSNGTLTKGNDSFVYGLGHNHNTIVTSTVNGTTITYTAFDADETTGVRTVADDAVVTRQGDVFSFSRALDAQVYNLQGALLLNQKGTRNLSIATLPQGVYVLKAGANKQKFVK
ncbi:MAG: T9SS type A sorting domain-containing protein, partial [Prevotella sp.]